MTAPRESGRPGADPILVVLVVMVSLLCLFPTLMGDLTSLTTDPGEGL